MLIHFCYYNYVFIGIDVSKYRFGEAKEMDTSKIHTSGILKKGEDIIEYVLGSMKRQSYDVVKGSIVQGSLLLTNKRLLFLEKPGFFSKGLNVMFSCSLGDIVSVSPSGVLGKKLTVNVKSVTSILQNIFSCKNSELFAQKLVGAKDSFVEEKTIEAKRVIIEEGNKDDAMEILKKRLARGEITLEEFHQKVQRT